MEIFPFEMSDRCMACAGTDLDRWVCDQEHFGMHYVEMVGDVALIPHRHFQCRSCSWQFATLISDDVLPN